MAQAHDKIKLLAETLTVDQRLKLEFLRRTSNGVIGVVMVISLLLYSFPIGDKKPLLWPEAAYYLLVAAIFRFVVGKTIKDPQRLLKYFPFLSILSPINALVWGFACSSAIYTYGISSIEGAGFVIVMCGILAGFMYAGAPDLARQRIYILCGSIPIILTDFYLATSTKERFFGWSVMTMAIYLISAATAHGKDLRNGYEGEEQVLKEKEKLQGVINSMPGFVAVANQDGQWLEKSASFDRFALQPALQAAKENFLGSNLISQTQQLEWTDVLSTEPDQTVAYAVSFERINYPENSVIVAGVPVTELRVAQKQLEIQRSKAEYSSRLATLGEMAGGVAHEINNPLAVILGHSTQLIRELGKEITDREKALSKAEKINKTVGRIARIVQGLRTFARQGEADPLSPISLKVIVEETLELCTARFHQAGVKLEVQEVPDVELSARSVQLCQVLMNLLNNAFDAVKTEPTKIVKMNFHLSDDRIKILISDSGPGIPEKIVNRVFEPFYTTKDVGQGTGLGLSISKSIMLEHNGDLSILQSSSPTTFQISLPILSTENKAA